MKDCLGRIGVAESEWPQVRVRYVPGFRLDFDPQGQGNGNPWRFNLFAVFPLDHLPKQEGQALESEPEL
jgi:hypothetical protein